MQIRRPSFIKTKTALSLWLFLPSEVELRMAGMAHSTKMHAGEWNLSPHTETLSKN